MVLKIISYFYNKIICVFFFGLSKKYKQFKKISKEKVIMKDFTIYLSTAPVMTLISVTVVAGLLIEINRFFPDALIFGF
jgi:photosystem I subunit 9